MIHIQMSFDFLFERNQIGSTVLAKQDSDVEDLDIYSASAMLDLSSISSMHSNVQLFVRFEPKTAILVTEDFG